MYFPQFLIGASVTLVLIFGWIYSVTGLLWSSFIWMVIAANVLQVGYFVYVLFVIFRRVSEAVDADRAVGTKPDGAFPAERDGIFF
jgi:hypothetical protein